MLILINHAKIESGPDPGHKSGEDGRELIHKVRGLLQSSINTSPFTQGEDVTAIGSGTANRCKEIVKKMRKSFPNARVLPPDERLGPADFEPFSQNPAYVAGVLSLMQEYEDKAPSYKVLCVRRQVIIAIYKALGWRVPKIEGGSIFEFDSQKKSIRSIWSGKEAWWTPNPST